MVKRSSGNHILYQKKQVAVGQPSVLSVLSVLSVAGPPIVSLTLWGSFLLSVLGLVFASSIQKSDENWLLWSPVCFSLLFKECPCSRFFAHTCIWFLGYSPGAHIIDRSTQTTNNN